MKDNIVDNHLSYSLLIEDYKELLTFILPTDNNMQAYSHRVYEIYLRAATEFENICKQKLIELADPTSPKDMTIKNYYKLFDLFKLKDIGISLRFWIPNKDIYPFQDWTPDKGPIWYKEYNLVKHNRTENMHLANLNNLTTTIGALYILLYKIYSFDFDLLFGSGSINIEESNGRKIITIGNSMFSIIDYSIPE